ncbi:sensor histidine kinase [Sphingobium nicotianae]|uniref:histidine kinase n=1 Tax=Sphingobium nicotianae TaxID=2782607 RepID=A0A9X1ITE0_9SPHN|nr:HAMP domain-containing sensor histidine kinase [Sphingobium nicotianae]MBT2189134.1 HAMP domain-containing histidine kinase [Sphingobium nicotianae]
MSGTAVRPARGMRWLRSSHVRFIGLILLLEILFGAALLLSVTQLVRADLDVADSAIATQGRDTLLAIGRDEGDGALQRAITERASGEKDAVVLLADQDGKRIAGNLSVWPPNVGIGTHWLKIDLYRIGDNQPAPFGIAAAQLPDGRRLLVGQRTDDSDQIRRTVEDALFTALLMALPLALVGAWLVVHIIDRRIAHIAAAAAGVGAGDIDRRVPLDGSGDSFDVLGGAINTMLDRIGGLLLELRTVTNSIAHDLRSPLTRMRARIDRAMETEEPEALRGAIDGISREADELLAMLGTALEISRMEAGIGRDRFARTDLGAMLADIGELYEPLVDEQGRKLIVSIETPASLPVHRELLGQALSNLIDNALKYGAGGMTLYLAKENGQALIGLADEGPGIPVERETEALRRFGRLDSSRGIAGAGLGLSLVAAVARMHGGVLRFGRRDDLFAVEILLPVTG